MKFHALKNSFLFFCCCIFFFSFTGIEPKKITGNFIADIDLYDMKVNDTLVFTKTKYNDGLYQWGGAVCGIELSSTNSFSEFHNVLCSSESDPLRYSDEKWTMTGDLIRIDGPERSLEWKIIGLKNKKLTVLVLKSISK
jgi:hypothetical protein